MFENYTVKVTFTDGRAFRHGFVTREDAESFAASVRGLAYVLKAEVL